MKKVLFLLALCVPITILSMNLGPSAVLDEQLVAVDRADDPCDQAETVNEYYACLAVPYGQRATNQLQQLLLGSSDCEGECDQQLQTFAQEHQAIASFLKPHNPALQQVVNFDFIRDEQGQERPIESVISAFFAHLEAIADAFAQAANALIQEQRNAFFAAHFQDFMGNDAVAIAAHQRASLELSYELYRARQEALSTLRKAAYDLLGKAQVLEQIKEYLDRLQEQIATQEPCATCKIAPRIKPGISLKDSILGSLKSGFNSYSHEFVQDLGASLKKRAAQALVNVTVPDAWKEQWEQKVAPRIQQVKEVAKAAQARAYQYEQALHGTLKSLAATVETNLAAAEQKVKSSLSAQRLTQLLEQQITQGAEQLTSAINEGAQQRMNDLQSLITELEEQEDLSTHSSAVRVQSLRPEHAPHKGAVTDVQTSVAAISQELHAAVKEQQEVLQDIRNLPQQLAQSVQRASSTLIATLAQQLDQAVATSFAQAQSALIGSLTSLTRNLETTVTALINALVSIPPQPAKVSSIIKEQGKLIAQGFTPLTTIKNSAQALNVKNVTATVTKQLQQAFDTAKAEALAPLVATEERIKGLLKTLNAQIDTLADLPTVELALTTAIDHVAQHIQEFEQELVTTTLSQLEAALQRAQEQLQTPGSTTTTTQQSTVRVQALTPASREQAVADMLTTVRNIQKTAATNVAQAVDMIHTKLTPPTLEELVQELQGIPEYAELQKVLQRTQRIAAAHNDMKEFVAALKAFDTRTRGDDQAQELQNIIVKAHILTQDVVPLLPPQAQEQLTAALSTIHDLAEQLKNVHDQALTLLKTTQQKLAATADWIDGIIKRTQDLRFNLNIADEINGIIRGALELVGRELQGSVENAFRNFSGTFNSLIN